jgi:hypothetical protein
MHARPLDLLVPDLPTVNCTPVLFAPRRRTARRYWMISVACYYGVDLHDIFRRGAYYVDRILQGTNPSDLPIERPTMFDFVVNVRTANTQGITLPETVRAQVTRLIE